MKEKYKDFEIFKSNVCHSVKYDGDNKFIEEISRTEKIQDFFQKNQFLECFYLLGMVDYLCKENNLPFNLKYDSIRKYKLKKPVFPRGVITECVIYGNDFPKISYLEKAIPEFLRFNIIEAEVRNVC